MPPKITPEIRDALARNPVGPVRLDVESSDEPVFIVRLGDFTQLRDNVDTKIRDALAEADRDVAEGRTGEWDAKDIKKRGQERLQKGE